MLSTYTAKYTKIDAGYMGQLIDWPEVITEGTTLDDCRESLQNALQEMIAAYRTVARPSRAVKRRIVAALDARPAPAGRWWPVAVLALAAAALFVVARGGLAGALFDRARVERERPQAPYDGGAERSAAPMDTRAPA